MKLGRTRLKLHVTTAVTLGISLQCNMTPCSLVISSDSRKEYFASEIRVDGPAELPHGSYTKWCGLHSFIHSFCRYSFGNMCCCCWCWFYSSQLSHCHFWERRKSFLHHRSQTHCGAHPASRSAETNDVKLTIHFHLGPKLSRDVPQNRCLVVGLSTPRPGLSPRSVYVGFVAGKLALGLFCRVLRYFPVSIVL